MRPTKPAFAPLRYTPDCILDALVALDADDPLAVPRRDPRKEPRSIEVAAYEDSMLVGFRDHWSPSGIWDVYECKEKYLEAKREGVRLCGIHLRLLYTIGPNEAGFAHVHGFTEVGWQMNRDAGLNGVRDALAEPFRNGNLKIDAFVYGRGGIAYIVDHAAKTPNAPTIAATPEVLCPAGPECAAGCKVQFDDPQFLDPRRYFADGIPSALRGAASAIRQQVRMEIVVAHLPNIHWDAIDVDGCASGPGSSNQRVDDVRRVLDLIRCGTSRREIAKKLRMGRHRLRDLERALRAAGLLDDDASPSVSLGRLARAVRVDDPETSRSPLAAYESEIDRMRLVGTSPTEIAKRLENEHPGLSTSERAVRRLLRSRDERARKQASRPRWAIVDARQLQKSHVTETGRLARHWVLVMSFPSTGRAFAAIAPRVDGHHWAAFHVDAFRALGSTPEHIAMAPGAVADVRARFTDELALREYSVLALAYDFAVHTTAVVPDSVRGLADEARRECASAKNEEDLQRALDTWCRASNSTTVGRSQTTTIPRTRPITTIWRHAKVRIDNHVQFEGARYSVPAYLIGQRVEVSRSDNQIFVYAQAEQVAEHGRKKRGRATQREHEVRTPTAAQMREIEQLIRRARNASPPTEREVRELLTSTSFTTAYGRAQAIIAAAESAPCMVVDPPLRIDLRGARRDHVPAGRPGVVRAGPGRSEVRGDARAFADALSGSRTQES